MIIKLATKRNVNGNRKYLAFDTERKEFSRSPARWYCREDFIETTLQDIRRTVDQLRDAEYTEIDNL